MGVKLLFRVTPIADIYAVARREIFALTYNRTGISLSLTHSLLIMPTEVLRLYLNLCIIHKDLLLLTRNRYGCEFLAESCDFYHKILFPGLNPLNPELNPICYLLALLGAHHFLHVSRIMVKLLTFRRLKSCIYGAPILDVSRSHTTTQHSR